MTLAAFVPLLRRCCLPARRLCSHTAGVGAKVISRRDDGSYHIPETRLNELMAREVAHLASEPMESFSLQHLLDVSVDELAEICRKEGPKRLALRIRLLESLPGMQAIPELVQMHEMLSRWYKSLRLLPPHCDLQDFIQKLRMIRKEGLRVVPLVAVGIHNLQLHAPDDFEEGVLDTWLDGFFLSRVSTNALGDHFVSRVLGKPMGIIDPECNATEICTKAAKLASKLCLDCTGHEPAYVVENYEAGGNGQPTDEPCISSYIPSYLMYTILEMLKNSFKATVDSASRAKADIRDRPVCIRICRDEQRMAIMISDLAGGIPLDVGDKIWSYLHGAAARSVDDGEATRLAGYGVGLPLSRLHVRYLHGSLDLTTYPGYGTQAHILLPRIDANQMEVLPQESSAPAL